MSRRADTWMPFYTADYARDTLHLTRDQHGGYLLLLMACWNAGGRIKNDPAMLAAITKATPAEWRKLAPVLLPFFTDEGEFITHKRVIAEHEKAARLSDARREAGAKGGRPRSQTKTNEKPIAVANENQTASQNKTPSQSHTPTELVSVEDKSSTAQELTQVAWGLATDLLTGAGNCTEPQARSFFGGLLKKHGLTAPDLLGSITNAHQTGTPRPREYLTKAAEGIARRRAEQIKPKRVGFV